ncbi:MAG TPA: hypothetical protein VN922_16325 [Bacteroidia bacterium]|nr:hypothetical protein [Bacteroidia bacterium]
MKKTILTYLVIFCFAITTHAQNPYGPKNSKKNILSAIGVAGGITYGKQIWDPEGPLATEKYRLRVNGAVLAEFFHHPIYRWRTELEYNLMGTTEHLDAPANTNVVNKTNYISFNNYLKVNFKETGFIPYFLIGPRLEYLLIKKPEVYAPVIQHFSALHVTGAIGIGAEAVWDKPIRPFIEAFYNHDIMPSYSSYYADGLTPTNIVYHAYELRIGLKYFFEGTKKDVCPKVINPAGN